MKLNEHHTNLILCEKFVELRKRTKLMERKQLEVSASETDAKVED
jgi:hypothetical protein